MGSKGSKDGIEELEDYEFLFLIGKGAWGKVWQVRKKVNGEIYAMKVLKKEDIYQTDSIDHIKLERQVLEKCGKHPFITNLNYAFQTKEKLYLVLDFINGGSLFFHYNRRDFIEEEVRFITAEIVIAIDFLHSENILYRDLKLENVLLDCEGHVRLTDFGLSAQVEPVRKRHHSFSGTAIYLAPEIIEDLNTPEKLGHNNAVDFWALGVVTHLLLSKKPPFTGQDKTQLYEEILSKEVKIDEHLSTPTQSFIRGLLNKNPEKRLGLSGAGVKTLKNHPFYSTINWKDIEDLKVSPPFKPVTNGPEDLQNMDHKIPYSDHKSSRNIDTKILPKRTSNFRKFSYDVNKDPTGRTYSTPNTLGINHMDPEP